MPTNDVSAFKSREIEAFGVCSPSCQSHLSITQTTAERISAGDMPAEVIQDARKDLATLLGRLLEVKINARKLYFTQAVS